MPPYVLSPVVLADSDQLARNNMSAFWSDPNWRPHWRDKSLDFVIGEMKKRMPRNILANRETYRQQKAVDAETGELVGFARWILPEARATTVTGAPAWAELQMADVSVAQRLAIWARFHSANWDRGPGPEILNMALEHKTQAIMRSGMYMSLDLIAVDPRHQHRGIGTQLVESGIKEAEKMGVDVFIMAFKAGVGLYRKLGFAQVDAIVQDDSEWGGDGEFAAFFMTKSASSASTGWRRAEVESQADSSIEAVVDIAHPALGEP